MTSSKRSIKNFVIEEMGGFTHFLLWAILEWILIASLYVDGFIAFVSSVFAKFFELEPPCVLCTRVDHALVRKAPNTYYNESICECHKKDISSLAYCHVHRKLSDIHYMCDGCLLSFATEKHKSCLNDWLNDHTESVVDVQRCSCCCEPLKTKDSSKDLSSSFSNVHGSIITSPKSITCLTPTWKTEESRYTDIKLISDSELDTPNTEENEESCKTPNLLKNNKLFAVTLTDSIVISPGFASKASKTVLLEQEADLLLDTNDEASGDGDSCLRQLKKQARLDRKALQTLSMELEEERYAAAVAANNAMAMITRLQEEKASVQMQALQYQRMMEEQAEYDQEAIQILQKLLAKRDEHVRVMELELESYRVRYGDIRKVVMDECEGDADASEYYQEWRSQSSSSFGDVAPEPVTPSENNYTSPFGNENATSLKDFNDESHSGRSVENEGDIYEEPLLDFDNEKHQLYSMLRNLESHIESSSLEDEDESTVQESRVTLKREVSQIKERLRILEVDSGFLKHTAMTLQKGEKGAELLTEIAQHLKKLCHSEDISTTIT
ncbi:putative myosin-binding protein 5 [Bidens hawaiensis]|uniref:putative myosin-binding protein 5 n=1 Tax=Bidens hawaiensis TaxID=980011 RepID=UPI00404AE6E8